jgi:hypothetical protein
MNQTVLNSGQFRTSATGNSVTTVSLLDMQPARQTKPAAARKPWWPIAAIVVGGILTLAWDGFLLWQMARGFIYILGSDF